MDIVLFYAQLTQLVVDATGMTRPMLHLHAGMAIYLVFQIAMRERRASLWAVLAVAQVELFNEVMNRLAKGSWHWGDTLADIALTLFWPVLCYLAGTYRRRRWAATPAATPATLRAIASERASV